MSADHPSRKKLVLVDVAVVDLRPWAVTFTTPDLLLKLLCDGDCHVVLLELHKALTGAIWKRRGFVRAVTLSPILALRMQAHCMSNDAFVGTTRSFELLDATFWSFNYSAILYKEICMEPNN